MIEDKIQQYYTDPKIPAAFSSFKNIYSYIKKKHPGVKKQIIIDLIKKNLTYAYYKQAPKIKFRRKTLSEGISYLYECDLIDLSRVSTNHKKRFKTFGFKFILTCIDVFSKFAFVQPLPSKTGKSTARGFMEIINRAQRLNLQPPKNLHTDRGREFFNRTFQKIVDDLKINHYASSGQFKASICERFNRTYMTRYAKLFASNYVKIKNAKKYKENLQHIVDGYNNTVSRTHGFAPKMVTYDDTNIIWNRLYGSYFENTPRIINFFPGDVVLLAKRKNIFDKGYSQTYLTDFYTIHDVILNTFPITYRLMNKNNSITENTFINSDLMRIEK